MEKHNLFDHIPAQMPEELVEVLAEGSGRITIERLVSRGHASPPGFWYDQKTIEWVVLLTGSAVLSFANENHPVTLKPGDWLRIPAHSHHRVEETSIEPPTVWLAVHWDEVT